MSDAKRIAARNIKRNWSSRALSEFAIVFPNIWRPDEYLKSCEGARARRGEVGGCGKGWAAWGAGRESRWWAARGGRAP